MTSVQAPRLTASEFGVELGCQVLAADDKRLGTVSDVRGPYFKVHRRLFGGDHWFDVTDVVAVFEDRILLDFEKGAAAEHEIPTEVVNDGRLDARADHLLDDEEMQAQRERMERELGGH